ncbi:hypothetical protein F4779DRAFT_499467 [Xylariaceae sp. FL0662B]|nr:hypothetical protein F4779DRAFT_499467 [Xylariaceae sp. FL0662B]
MHEQKKRKKIMTWTSERRWDVSTSTNNATFRPYHTLQWYTSWLRGQINRQPAELFNCMPGFDRESDASFNTVFLPLAEQIYRAIGSRPAPSIDTIVETLLRDGAIDAGENGGNINEAINLVFSAIGWFTMLYKPDFNSSPPSQFCITDEMDGHAGEGHMSLKQERISSKKRLSDFLLGFGLMLPPRNYHTMEDPDDMKAFNRIRSVDSSLLNILVLKTIGRLKIEWTDCLVCHLELDKDAHTLYIFRYPSFCLASLAELESDAERSPIYSCSSDASDNSICASDQDVTELLKEVLLSYRVLFGQHSGSRKLFRRLQPFDNTSRTVQDDLLIRLCANKDIDHALGMTEKVAYKLAEDFPHLRTRLVRLNAYLDQRKPRSWRELWMDKRDSASWLTFWAVIIFGGMGILLAFVQVVLQAVQLSLQVQQPG